MDAAHCQSLVSPLVRKLSLLGMQIPWAQGAAGCVCHSLGQSMLTQMFVVMQLLVRDDKRWEPEKHWDGAQIVVYVEHKVIFHPQR